MNVGAVKGGLELPNFLQVDRLLQFQMLQIMCFNLYQNVKIFMNFFYNKLTTVNILNISKMLKISFFVNIEMINFAFKYIFLHLHF